MKLGDRPPPPNYCCVVLAWGPLPAGGVREHDPCVLFLSQGESDDSILRLAKADSIVSK